MDVLVIDWLMQQVVQAKATGDDQHQALVKLCRNLKQGLVVVLKLQAIVLDVIDHPGLLLVEELPYLQNVFQMVPGNFVEMAFLS